MSDHSRAEVLVVDDDRLMRTFVSDALDVRGFAVMVATNGKEAVELLKTRDVDVVVCDMVMPELDGLGVLEWVQANSSSTEVVMLTGHADMETALSCLRRGAFDLVRKEKEMPQLVPTVERAVERRHLREARSLQSASHLIFTTEERQDLPERIVEVATKVMDADDASLMLPDVNGQLYVAFSNILPSQVQNATRVNLGERIAGRAAADRAPLLLHGPLDEDLRFPEIDDVARDIFTSIVYPLFSGDELLGVLNLNRVGDGHRPFRDHDIERAALLASQIVLALENQRLIRRVTATDKFTAVGQLSTAIAHEINNPITFVLSSVEFVLEQLRPLLDQGKRITPDDCFRALGGPDGAAEMCEALADAREGATRIRDVVRDLRNMVRANPSDREPFDLNGSIHAALRIAAAELRPVARTSLELGPDLVVIGCRGTMSQVFVNLFMNAAYALKDAPRGFGEMSIRSRREGTSAVVEVVDNGPGIPPEQLARIFEPFFTTKPVGVGTGLGLPMCREIIEWHGGEMRVHSSLDDGTVFTLSLPAIGIDGFSDARPSLPRTAAERSAHRVLVVDDEEAIGRAFTRLLPECEVVAVTSGASALEILATDREFVAILCDVVMPEMSGIELHAELEKLDPSLAARMVFITGSVGYADVRDFAETKGTPVLEKPVNMDNVRVLLDQRAGN